MAKYSKTLADKITNLIAEQLCSVADICKATGISRNTFYKWKRENPDFCEEVEDAMEYRNEALLSMAYSSIKQRLEKHTIVEEKDTYIPDELNSDKLNFKSKVVRKKEHLPDLRTIKMILDRADKDKNTRKAEKPERKIKEQNGSSQPVSNKETQKEQIILAENRTKRGQKGQNTDKRIVHDKKKATIKNIKDSIQILGNCNHRKSSGRRKNLLMETA